ncbi:uncharacterized protein LOC134274586 isoform X1 [Saccostrea cucullata]|uniref:uncharacterized protein LOC134274586 isoform X1 n=1 Tax=Saccostrea cuccullata TaxID=36930 RepID=UPI002ED42059
MAASSSLAIPATCCIYVSEIGPKQRRLVSSPVFQVKSQLEEVFKRPILDTDQYVCVPCFTKLNRLSKIDFDLQHKLASLKAEKNEILEAVRAKIKTFTTSSPAKTVPKRHIIHSPTPRKLKKSFPAKQKRTPYKATVTQDRPVLTPKSSKRRKLFFKDPPADSIRISYRGKLQGVVKSRIVKGQWKDVLKSILRGDKSKTLAKKIVAIESLRNDIHILINDRAVKELKTMCKLNNPSFLRNTTGRALCGMDLLPFIKELQEKCPVLNNFLESVMGNCTTLRLSVAASVILFNRNNHMSAVHHVIGQILDQGGATDETIRLLNNMGLTVGPKAVYKKKVELQEVQRKRIKDTVLQQRQEEEIKATADDLTKSAVLYSHLSHGQYGGLSQCLQQSVVSSLEGGSCINKLHETVLSQNQNGNLQNFLQVPVRKRFGVLVPAP